MDEIQIAKKLIEIESISPEDNGCFDVIKSELKDLKFKFEQIDYLNIKNLIIHRESHQKKTFCFLGIRMSFQPVQRNYGHLHHLNQP